jgi:DNA processing protein
MSWGPNLLIKQGAKLVQEWNDVVVELPLEDRQRLSLQFREQFCNRLIPQEKEEPVTSSPLASSHASGAQTSGTMKGVSQAVLAALALDAPVSLDNLMETLGQRPEGASPSEIIAVLFDLEMSGLVRQLPGKSFLKVWAE